MLDDDKLPNTPIVSSYINDDGMAKIINVFLDKIPKSIADLEANFTSANKDNFCKLVHQFKGAGGGYGFAIITKTAAGIEMKLRISKKEWKEEIQKNMDEFITVLQRVHAGRGLSGHT